LDVDLNLNPHNLDANGSSRNAKAFKNYVDNVVGAKDEFNISGHGHPSFLYDYRDLMNPSTFWPVPLIDFLNKVGGEKWGNAKKVRIHSCDAGKGDNSFAQWFADKTGKDVIAPTDKLTTSGKILNNGVWKTFHPRLP
jgi:hypothetical protein